MSLQSNFTAVSVMLKDNMKLSEAPTSLMAALRVSVWIQYLWCAPASWLWTVLYKTLRSQRGCFYKHGQPRSPHHISMKPMGTSPALHCRPTFISSIICHVFGIPSVSVVSGIQGVMKVRAKRWNTVYLNKITTWCELFSAHTRLLNDKTIKLFWSTITTRGYIFWREILSYTEWVRGSSAVSGYLHAGISHTNKLCL